MKIEGYIVVPQDSNSYLGTDFFTWVGSPAREHYPPVLEKTYRVFDKSEGAEAEINNMRHSDAQRMRVAKVEITFT